MGIQEFQKLSIRTLNNSLSEKEQLANMVIGASCEFSEAGDSIKKYLFQGHELDKKHIEEEARKLNDALNPEEVEARKKADEEARQREELQKKLESERLAEIERLKQEKEEAQREYFKTQQELLTQIRDALNK